MNEKEYKVEVMVTHIAKVWAESEDEAREKGEMKVFEEKVNHEGGELITGYRITLL